MRRCFHALISCLRRDATGPGDLAGILLYFSVLYCVAFFIPPAHAQGPPLRDIEVRSFLGEPLKLRIALATSAQRSAAATCHSVIDDDRRENALRSGDLMLTMVELSETRYLLVQGNRAFNEPVARFSLRLGCPGEPAVDHEFTALIDPPPFTTLPVFAAPAATATGITPPAPIIAPESSKPPARARPVVPASGTWDVLEGDTLARLATGIHPKNHARQRQYLAVLRELNPQIANLAGDAPLSPGMKLAMPDLLTLSGILPQAAMETAPPDMPSSVAASSAAKKHPATEKPVPRPAPQVVAKSAAASAAIAPEPVNPAPQSRAVARREGFQLRLSGSEMDLSRSRNVTEEQRRLLREKQLTLDADDQVAALLSLKNTVRQLEKRLNEMQLTLSASPSMRATAPLPLPAPPAASTTSAASATSVSPAAATTAVASAPSPKLPPAPAAMPSPDARPAVVPVAPPVTQAPNPASVTTAPEPSPPPETSMAETLSSYLPSPLLTGAIVVALLALAAWAWSRRDDNAKSLFDSDLPRAPVAEAPPATTTQSRRARAERSMPTRRGPVREPLFDEPTDFQVEEIPAPPRPAHDAVDVAHRQVDAPVIFEDTPARFEVDSRPATTVDFLVGMDEKLPEDRVRRLQYMHERYPELKSNTISIDDADSVINSARLYYEDADRGNGRDKASELLTFAVEERPQEIRFWLAQFEIFRLENMVAEFTAMAGKFHVLFSHTPAWPKVRHIGHELDPGNPLFAAGGGPLLAGETRFDPIGENWLNAPMDFTSDALMSDLRVALLADHGVSRADFESITARLSETAETS